jgi:LysR family glycine cleavage system transcriptional activator
MYKPMPPLNALRAFEAAARHLSLTKAAQELNVTAGALSHQIRGLEELLGIKLFERRVRSIGLTPAGKLLYPGLQTAFSHIRDALATLSNANQERVLVISTPPGFTSKWLAARLYRFASAYPEVDVRVSSSINNANFTSDGVDAAVRNLPSDAASDSTLVIEKLIELFLVSPKLIEMHGPLERPEVLKSVPLIHDDTLAGRAKVSTWAEWFKAAGVDAVDVSRGCASTVPITRSMLRAKARAFCLRTMCWPMMTCARGGLLYQSTLPCVRIEPITSSVRRIGRSALTCRPSMLGSNKK